ncbi:MAG: hypothetical protein AAF220_08490 [Pseudomonadota bacterium]
MMDVPPNSGTSAHVYPPESLVSDYIRTAIGVVVTGGLLLFMETALIVALILLGGFILFAAFGIRTWLRTKVKFLVTPEGLQREGYFPGSFLWSDLSAVSLRYYAVRKDSEASWMTLSLKFGGTSISIESTISDFDAIARVVADHASHNRITVSERTETNFAGIGLALGDARVHDDI